MNAKNHPLYEAALEDCDGNENQTAKYLEHIEIKAADFIRQRDKIWDREELMTTLEKIQRTEGNFVCFLGGKNTGKSLLINHLAKHPSTIAIDLRGNADIYENLTRVLNALPREISYGFMERIAKHFYLFALKCRRSRANR